MNEQSSTTAALEQEYQRLLTLYIEIGDHLVQLSGEIAQSAALQFGKGELNLRNPSA